MPTDLLAGGVTGSVVVAGDVTGTFGIAGPITGIGTVVGALSAVTRAAAKRPLTAQQLQDNINAQQRLPAAKPPAPAKASYTIGRPARNKVFED
jgi:hypothetical protein